MHMRYLAIQNLASPVTRKVALAYLKAYTMIVSNGSCQNWGRYPVNALSSACAAPDAENTKDLAGSLDVRECADAPCPLHMINWL
jgi:hypothetical protein